VSKPTTQKGKIKKMSALGRTRPLQEDAGFLRCYFEWMIPAFN